MKPTEPAKIPPGADLDIESIQLVCMHLRKTNAKVEDLPDYITSILSDSDELNSEFIRERNLVAVFIAESITEMLQIE